MRRLTISDSLLRRALDMRPIARREVAPGYVEHVVACMSGRHPEGHVVTEAAGRVVCDCESWRVCGHVLCSAGRPALECIFQLRLVARDLEDLDMIVEVYEQAVGVLPMQLRNLVRLEANERRNQLTDQQSAAQAA